MLNTPTYKKKLCNFSYISFLCDNACWVIWHDNFRNYLTCKEIITKERTVEALDRLKVDRLGLDEVDHKYLLGIIHRFKGGPVGLESLAVSIGEEPRTLEDVYEPYLLQIGLIKRTPRGRIATYEAYKHLNIEFKD